jgi:citrate synthase
MPATEGKQMDREPLFRRKTSISYKTGEKTVLRGYDLSELAEKGYSFCDALFVLYQDRFPTENEEKMLRYEMAEFMEHSMSPSTVAALGVTLGRPDLPAAIAAAIMTFGGVHGPGGAYGDMLNTYIERARVEGKSPDQMARTLVNEYLDAKKRIVGMGHPQHVDGDPRAEPTHRKQEELELDGIYLEFQRAIEKHLNERREQEGKPRIGANVVGGGNPALADIGFAPDAAWCINSVSRGFSCAAHALFSMKRSRAWAASRNEPMVQMIDLTMIKYVGPEDRPVPSQDSRQEYARKQKEDGEYRQWVI